LELSGGLAVRSNDGMDSSRSFVGIIVPS